MNLKMRQPKDRKKSIGYEQKAARVGLFFSQIKRGLQSQSPFKHKNGDIIAGVPVLWR
jgi:hypothetical protein